MGGRMEKDTVSIEELGVLVLRVNGLAKSQPRPRLANGHVVSIADKGAKIWRERVRTSARCALVERYGYRFGGVSGAIRVDMVFSFATKDAKRIGEYHTNKPDKDNLEKMVLDGLEGGGLFAVGDQQVVVGEVSKVWCASGDEGVVIVVSSPRKKNPRTDTNRGEGEGLGW